jgi:hypothetical protein
MFQALCPVFFVKPGKHRKNVKISANRWELKINKDCENLCDLKITKIVNFQNNPPSNVEKNCE